MWATEPILQIVETVYSYVEEVTNSYGYTSSAKYDFSFGQVVKSIDINGNEISYELDDLGRVHTIIGPYEKAAGKGYLGLKKSEDRRPKTEVSIRFQNCGEVELYMNCLYLTPKSLQINGIQI